MSDGSMHIPRISLTQIGTCLSTSPKIWAAIGLIVLMGSILSAALVPGLNADSRAGLGMGGGLVGFILLCIAASQWREDEIPVVFGGKKSDLCTYSFLDEFYPNAVKEAKAAVQNGLTQTQDRAFGALMGGACGDAAGAPLEFYPFRKEPYIDVKTFDMTPKGFKGLPKAENSFDLKPGQYTDDTSMGLCLADACLKPGGIDAEGNLDQVDLMHRFLKWWERGYNNAFGNDPHRPRGQCSVGLGGNIGKSFNDATLPVEGTSRIFATQAGDKRTSGNGSIMRGASAGLAGQSVEHAHKLGEQQSYTTHQGDEAAECAAFMAELIYTLVYDRSSREPKEILADVLDNYKSKLQSFQDLIESKKHATKYLEEGEEDWDWSSPNFTYNPKRLDPESDPGPGYIGSYAMDAMAMALHCILHTDNYRDAVVMAIKNGGDADSVGAVVGQIAGAMYGYFAIPKSWRDAVGQWDNGTIIGRAYLMCQREKADPMIWV